MRKLLMSIKLNESLLSMILGLVSIVVVGLLVFNFYSNVEDRLEVESFSEQPCSNYEDWRISRVPARCYEYFGGGQNEKQMAR